MGSIFSMLVFALMCILGGLSSLYVVIALPTIIVWKLYRKIRYGEKIM